MNLDIRTLAFVSSVTSLILFGWLAYVGMARKTYPGFRHWTVSAFFFFTGMVLISLRNIWPDLLTIVAGNTIFVGAFILMEAGVLVFDGFRPKTVVYAVSLAILMVTFSYFSLVRPDTAVRIVIVSMIVSAYCFRIGFHLWSRRASSPTTVRWLLLVTFVVLGLWDVARSVLTVLMEADVSDFMRAGHIQSTTLIAFQAGSVLIYAGLVTLNAERIETDLTKAMENIRTLEGFLPICANCKKIRDDKGFWNNVEEYIEHHTEAVMTHGICPDCEKKLYPDVTSRFGSSP